MDFAELLTQIGQKYGLFAVLLVLVLVYHEKSMASLWTRRLADKDEEIKRLVKERERLQDSVLRNRLTSGGQDDD